MVNQDNVSAGICIKFMLLHPLTLPAIQLHHICCIKMNIFEENDLREEIKSASNFTKEWKINIETVLINI